MSNDFEVNINEYLQKCDLRDVLSFGNGQNGNSKGWRKGKIKFVVQFEPDEANNHADSDSLDDIREKIDTAN